MNIKIAIIGECMLELSTLADADSSYQRSAMLSYGGDTLNTAIYLQRLGAQVEYITALGDDHMSDWMLAEWQREGLQTSLVKRMADSAPGMYLINLDLYGERSFLYWRKNSPASRLFDDQQLVDELFDSLVEFPYVYVTGISLGILPEESQQRLLNLLARYRKQGGKIFFDTNFRPQLWPDYQKARDIFEQMYRLTDIAFPTFEDEKVLNGYGQVKDVISALKALGVEEIVVKDGELGCTVCCGDVQQQVPAEPVTPVDTTAAGDSFIAGYLAHRLTGNDVVSACTAGHALASKVIQHRGAIIPAEKLDLSS